MPQAQGKPGYATMVLWTIVPASGRNAEGVPRAFELSRDCEAMKAQERPSFVLSSLSPQIDFYDAFVILDDIHRPFGQHPAFVQHRDLSGDTADEIHIVLNHDQRMPAGQR